MNEPGQAPLPVQGKGAGEKGTDRDYPPLIVLGIALIALVIAGYGLVREMAKDTPFNPLQELSDKIGDTGDDIMGKLRGLTGKGGVPDSVRQGRRHVRRGYELYKKGKTGGALVEYEKALKLDPRNPDAWFWRGRVFLVQKDLDRALSDFEKTLLLKPDHVSAHDNMGWIYTQKGDREKAIHHLSQAIKLKPDNAWAYFNRGRLLYQKGEKEAALRDAQKACDLGYEKACQVVKQFKKK